MQIKQITILYIIISIISLFLVFSFTGKANAQTVIFDENFDSYTTGLLGTQGGWVTSGNVEVSENEAISGIKSLRIQTTATRIATKAVSSIADVLTLEFYINETGSCTSGSHGMTMGLYNVSTTTGGGNVGSGFGTICNSSSDYYFGNIGSEDILLNKNTWYKIWVIYNGIDEEVEIYVNETLQKTIPYIVISNGTISDIESIRMRNRSTSGGTVIYWDNIKIIEGLPYATNTTTRINWLTPPPDTISTTFDVDFEYYINSNDEDSDDWENILLQTCALSYFNDECEIHATSFTILYDQLVQETIEITTTRQGFHLGIISLWNNVSEDIDCPWWNFLCSDESIITGLSDSSRFNVETTEIEPDVPRYILDLDFDGSGLCDVAIVSGICNALMFLFIPSENSIQNFLSLQGDLAKKIPFGFVFSITEKMQNILETGGSEGSDIVVNLGEDSIGSITIFSWTDAKETLGNLGIYNTGIVNILSYIMWILMAVYVFTRLTRNKDL